MRKKVLAVSLKEPPTIHPLSGEMTLNAEKQLGIDMWTGEEAGFLTVKYQGKEAGIPLSNVRAVTWEKAKEQNAKQLG